MKQSTWRREQLGAAAIAIALLTSGCAAVTSESAGSRMSTVSQAGGTAPRTADGGVKSDPGPVLKRLPGLSGVASVSWMSGTVGDLGVPGPSTYWIDAVVTLDADTAQRLRGLATGPATTSDLAEQLRGSVPAGELRTSSALNQALAPVTGWTVQAAISADKPVLVIAALGQ